MTGHAESAHPTSRMRAALWVLALFLMIIGVALSIWTQSFLPLFCIALGLGLPLLPLVRRRP
jgi:EamA domain-containing membrane protein RarD